MCPVIYYSFPEKSVSHGPFATRFEVSEPVQSRGPAAHLQFPADPGPWTMQAMLHEKQAPGGEVHFTTAVFTTTGQAAKKPSAPLLTLVGTLAAAELNKPPCQVVSARRARRKDA